jgi:Bacterial membrane protein YfhO
VAGWRSAGAGYHRRAAGDRLGRCARQGAGGGQAAFPVVRSRPVAARRRGAKAPAGAGPRVGRAARWLVLGGTVVFQAWLLGPELLRPALPLNDDAFHIASALRVRDALRGQPATALDPWFSYWSLGYPVLHAYQPLAAFATGALGLFASEPAFLALFSALKLLLLLAFPLCVYLGARWLELAEPAALGAAAVAPLVATEGLYGLEYGSYLWRGTGLYTQLWAMDLLPLALGRSWAALRGRAGALGAGALLAGSFLAHAIYGYMAVVSFALAAGLALRPVGWRTVLRRAAPVLALAAAMVAFFVVPMLVDASALNRSRWEPVWKWDSYGHPWVLSHLASGELFDHGRLPVLTLLLAGGLFLALRRGAGPGERFAGWGFVLWLALYCGRPTWGPALLLLGISADVPLHRLIGGVHLFGILLAGLALGRLLGRLTARLAERLSGAATAGAESGPAARAARWAAPAAALLLLLPAVHERLQYIRQGMLWLRASEASVRAAAADLGALRRRLAALQAVEPGRVYPGLAAGWGNQFKIGEVRLFDFLSLWRMDAVAFLFHAMSLPSDVMVEFDENRPADYDAFDVRYVVMDAGRTPPPFLVPLERSGRFRLYAAPAAGRVGVGALGFRWRGGRNELYEIGSAWLKSGLPAQRVYGAVGLGSAERRPPAGGGSLPILRGWGPLPPPQSLAGAAAAAAAGSVANLRREGDDWTAEVECGAPALAVLKETYHPGWRVEVDGRAAPALQVTPGFVAAEVGPGRHRVAFRYRPSALKIGLFFLGLAAPLLWLAAPRSWRESPRGPGGPAGSRVSR